MDKSDMNFRLGTEPIALNKNGLMLKPSMETILLIRNGKFAMAETIKSRNCV
jgi:hypothetical protein